MFVWSKLTAEKWVDAWEERFAGNPAGTLVVTVVPGHHMARLEWYSEDETAVARIKEEFGGSIRQVKNRNWAALSEEPMPPIRVRDKLVICSARSKKDVAAAVQQHADRQVICVPADMAFGTGHHITTATVLRLLADESERFAKQGQAWTFGDLGCGSGILSIAALKLGAARVWGCDFDQRAVEVSIENAERNQAKDIVFEKVDILNWKPSRDQCWDVVAANLFADILENAFPVIRRVTQPGGVVFLSGILRSQADACLAAGEAAGLRMERRFDKGKWTTAVARRT